MKRALLITILAVSACSPVVRNTRASADGYIAQNRLADAERAYERAMNGIVTRREFDRLLLLRCDVRYEMARREVTELQKSGVATFADVDRLHEFVRRCPDFGPADNEISNLGAQIAERTLTEKADPLVAEGRLYEALALAEKATPYLPDSHARAEWLSSQRRAAAEPWAKGHAEAQSQNAPLTAATFARLHNRTGVKPEIPERFATVAAEKRAVRLQNVASGGLDAPCSALGMGTSALRPDQSSGTPYDVLHFHASNCFKTVDIERGTEDYTVDVQKVQKVKKLIAVSAPVTQTSTTAYRSCSTSSFGTGCSTVRTESKSYTYTKTEYKVVEVEELVTVQETRTRQVKWATSNMSASVLVTVSGPGPPVTRTAAARVLGLRAAFPIEMTDDEVRAQAMPAGAFGRLSQSLGREIHKVGLGLALEAATASRVAQLEQEFQAASERGDQPTMVELALVRWAAGAQLTAPETTVLQQRFGFDIAQTSPDTLPAVADAQWLNPVVQADVFEQSALDSFYEGIVVYGYPTNVSSFGAGYRKPEVGLVGQPDRSAIDAMLDGQLRYSLTSSKYHRGFGVLGGFDWGVSLGSRQGDDYQRSVPLPDYVDPEDGKERKLTLGMRFGFPLMVGFRTYFVGLFAGIVPLYTNFSIGHFFSEGGTIPLAGRLELRFAERYPIIVEGWYGHIGKGDNHHVGGTLLIPLRTSTGGSGGFWLLGRFDQLTIPAQIPGLFEKDDVFVPGVTTTSGSAGVGMAF